MASAHTHGLFAALLLATFVGCQNPQELERIVDHRGLLFDSAAERVGAFQATLLEEYDIDLAVDIPETSPGDLARYSHDMAEELEVGRLTSGARGVLLVIDAEAGMVRMEVGPGLEHAFPDIFVGRIERDQMAPFFARKRVSDGVEATVELLVARVREVIRDDGVVGADGKSGAAGAVDGALRNDLAAGAGAQQTAPIGDDGQMPPVLPTPDVPAQASPAEALAAYLEVLSRDDPSPNHSVYSSNTRQFLSDRVVTRAQLRNEHRLLSGAISSARFVQVDTLAVALFDGRSDVPPYFLVRSAEGWMLDLATSSRAIRFDLKNNWFYTGDAGHYGFAFK